MQFLYKNIVFSTVKKIFEMSPTQNILRYLPKYNKKKVWWNIGLSVHCLLFRSVFLKTWACTTKWCSPFTRCLPVMTASRSLTTCWSFPVSPVPSYGYWRLDRLVLSQHSLCCRMDAFFYWVEKINPKELMHKVLGKRGSLYRFNHTKYSHSIS